MGVKERTEAVDKIRRVIFIYTSMIVIFGPEERFLKFGNTLRTAGVGGVREYSGTFVSEGNLIIHGH